MPSQCHRVLCKLPAACRLPHRDACRLPLPLCRKEMRVPAAPCYSPKYFGSYEDEEAEEGLGWVTLGPEGMDGMERREGANIK
jgi:hypothetical protein